MRAKPTCKDCGLPYPFPMDSTLPHTQWKQVCDIGHDPIEIILCANCIVRRVSKIKGTVALRMEYQ